MTEKSTLAALPADLAELAVTHVAKYSALQPAAVLNDPVLPQDVKDIIAARRILPAVTSASATPGVHAGPVSGQDFAIAYVQCPPGTGPGLHKHFATVETFTCLKGRFRMSWGARGEHSVELQPYDVFVVPAGVDRAFTNVSTEEGMLQVLITGGTHDRQDISFPKATEDAIAKHGSQFVERYRNMGFMFDGRDR